MAIQNSIYLPDRMSKKKYFYDPLLEKGILNTVYSLGRDSSMDNEHYKDVCFCPSNNKLYALRTNSSTSVSKVDVICPNSTTKTCNTSCVAGPEAIITIENGGGAIAYCPSTDKIFTVSTQADIVKMSKINPQDNTVEVTNTGTVLVSASATSLVYNPMTDRLYASFSPKVVIVYYSTGGIDTSWPLESWSSTYSEITRLCMDPERNHIHLFDGSKDRSAGELHQSNYVDVIVGKNNSISYLHRIGGITDWLGPNHKVKDVIYCPYDSATYWLSNIDDRYTTRIFKKRGPVLTSEAGPQDEFKVIEINEDSGYENVNEYEKLIYCPDNNMIYVLGAISMHMINPADRYGIVPVTEFYDSAVAMKTNGVCYSPVNNRIYGVGNDGYITYIDPTS